MANKMKKYYGQKYWHETLYFWTIDEDDIEWRKVNDEIPKDRCLKAGDSEFYLLLPPFGDNDKNSVGWFSVWESGWDDTNLFIEDTEEFNRFKRNRI